MTKSNPIVVGETFRFAQGFCLYLGPKLRPGVDFGVIRHSSTSSIN